MSVAALAQPVEHRIRNAGVACSSHASGTISRSPLFANVRFFKVTRSLIVLFRRSSVSIDGGNGILLPGIQIPHQFLEFLVAWATGKLSGPSFSSFFGNHPFFSVFSAEQATLAAFF